MKEQIKNIFSILLKLLKLLTHSVFLIPDLLKKLNNTMEIYINEFDSSNKSNNLNKFIPCQFNSDNRVNILIQIKNRNDSLTSEYTPEQLIEEIRNSYTQIEIEYLLTNYEIQSKKYTDQSILSFVTLFIAIGAFAISYFKEVKNINSIMWFASIIIIICIVFIISRAFSPNGSKLNTAIFWLTQAKEVDEPQKNEQTDKDDDE